MTFAIWLNSWIGWGLLFGGSLAGCVLIIKMFPSRAEKLGRELSKVSRELKNKTAQCKKAEEALDESRSRFEDLAESIPEVLMLMDKSFTYTHWNKAAETFTGLRATQAVGKSVYEVFPQTPVVVAKIAYEKVMMTGHPHSFCTGLSVAGKLRCFEVIVQPFGQGLCVLAKDISESERIKKENQNLRHRLKEIEDMRGAYPFGQDREREPAEAVSLQA